METSLVSDEAQFAALQPEWERLFQRCSRLTPFQSFAWNTVWWRHYQGNSSLAIIVVRDQGELVGIGPFVWQRHWGVVRITPMGAGRFAYFGPLVLPGRDDVAQAIATRIATMFRYGVLHIPYYQTRDEALAVLLACLNTLHWKSSVWVRNVCHYLYEPDGYNVFLSKKTSKARYNLKREEKLLSDMGRVDFQGYSGPRLDKRVVERIAAIQASSWLARRGQEPLGSSFYRDLLPALAEFDLAVVYILSLDSRDAAFVLTYRHNLENICIYIGFDEHLARLSPGKVLMHRCVQTILERGDHVIDFHFGDAEYKRFWGSRTKYAMEFVAWRGTAACLYSWFPARLRGLVNRFPRTKNAIKRMRASIRRLTTVGTPGRCGGVGPPPGAIASECSSKPDHPVSNP